MSRAALLLAGDIRTPDHFAITGPIAVMALALCEHARRRGLIVVRMLASRVQRSASKHVQLRDPLGQHWLIRISDHPAPAGTGYDIPHFDLVSPDGRAGYSAGAAFVDSIAQGEAEWQVPQRDRQRRGHHVRGQKHKPGGCR